ncbi:3476_t:CDS:2, partial [Funneliformis geosporum]
MSEEKQNESSKQNTLSYIAEKIDDISDIAEPIVKNTVKLTAAIGEAATAAVPFAKFIPLISEIGNVLNEIVEIVQAAEHNKRTCEALLQRVHVAELAVFDLRIRRNEKKEFFVNRNYLYLQNLVNVIANIKKFAGEISQMNTLTKYLKSKGVEKTFKELCREFDSWINLLSFTILVEEKFRAEDEAEQLKCDQDDLNKYLAEMGVDVKEIGTDVKELKGEFSSMVLKINTMNNKMEKLIDEQNKISVRKETNNVEIYQKKIDSIFTERHTLVFSNYKETNDHRNDGRVTRYLNIRNEAQELAFKNISDVEDKNSIRNQVTIFKEFQDWPNIIKFYGLAYDENKSYLVTEWAEFGNLHEFYIEHERRIDESLKLRISLDIARGLNFLRSVGNILITVNDTAKLANFKLSRYSSGPTKKHNQNLERVRYCAPELLDRAPNFKYDHKCEVYGFGILLWEIAEMKLPFQEYDDILTITELVLKKKYREPFSENNRMPIEFQELAMDAVNQDPEFRPKITDMFR